eukprot:CAMPEP_0184255188 /NCGR_PEP_ID=MMETSP0977-20130417/7904_1 /TAXON_ID=483370 /ORGANISM="non described non described, Strain CCMP2097" /LENGTH=70 /DNA_ID=CAMNT_0026560749 /DNA_START=215 /DNA_END=423 /DNA_ORIENTATION=-
MTSVDVLLQPAHHLGLRLRGLRAAERASLVVLVALAGTRSAKLLAAARVKRLQILVERQHIQADGASAAP